MVEAKSKYWSLTLSTSHSLTFCHPSDFVLSILLINWREDLPSELKLTPSNEGSALPHKLMMHLAYWWLLILLHRPFYRRQGVAGVDLTFSINVSLRYGARLSGLSSDQCFYRGATSPRGRSSTSYDAGERILVPSASLLSLLSNQLLRRVQSTFCPRCVQAWDADQRQLRIQLH